MYFLKLIDRIKNYKTWLFLIFPCCLYVSYLVLMIYVIAKSIYTPVSLVCLNILFIVASTLISIPIVIKKIKSKRKIQGIFSLTFFICFLALQVIYMVLVPKLVRLSEQTEILKTELNETSDSDYREKFDEWFKSYSEESSLSIAVGLVYSGSLVSLCLLDVTDKTQKMIDERKKDRSSTD